MSSSYKIALLLSLLAAPLLCELAAGDGDGQQSLPSKPILTRLSKDPATNLYTAAVKNGGGQLVLDLAGPLVWTTACPPQHRTIPCAAGVCTVANRNHRPNCPYTAGSSGSTSGNSHHCACSATAYNPANGQCGYGDLTTVHLSANATDGKTPLFPVSFAAVASCAPPKLLGSLPSGVAGVVGLSRAPLSLPMQMKTEKKFALCLPVSGEDGAAIIGGGPFWLQAAPPQQVSDRLRYTSLLKNPRNSAYYIGVTGVAVNGVAVHLPPGALSLSARQGTGGVALSTATPYTALRSDIYRPVRDAFAAVTAGIAQAPAARWPFDLCYQKSALPSTRVGLFTAIVDLMLAGGQNFTIIGSSAVVEVSQDAACFAFVDMGNTATTPAVDHSPAVVIGGHQMEDNLVVFDLEKWQFGYSGLLLGTMTRCGNFDFSMGSH